MKIYTEIVPSFSFKSIKGKKTIKENIYSDINLFLKNNISKEEYIKRFNNNMHLASNKPAFWNNLSIPEKLFISDIRTSLDLAESIKDISSTELIARMKRMLGNTK